MEQEILQRAKQNERGFSTGATLLTANAPVCLDLCDQLREANTEHAGDRDQHSDRRVRDPRSSMLT
jgi:hypothetical protein